MLFPCFGVSNLLGVNTLDNFIRGPHWTFFTPSNLIESYTVQSYLQIHIAMAFHWNSVPVIFTCPFGSTKYLSPSSSSGGGQVSDALANKKARCLNSKSAGQFPGRRLLIGAQLVTILDRMRPYCTLRRSRLQDGSCCFSHPLPV